MKIFFGALDTRRREQSGRGEDPNTTTLWFGEAPGGATARSAGKEVRQLGHRQDQHQGFVLGELPEAEALVERFHLLVGSLHDNGAGADRLGGGKRPPRCVDHQVGAQTAALIVAVDRELAQWDRLSSDI